MAMATSKQAALRVVALLKDEVPLHNRYLWQENRSLDIDLFLENVFLSYASRNPQLLSNLGLFESLGINDHNAHLTYTSPESLRYDLQEKKEILKQLKTYDVNTMSYDQKVSHAVTSWMLEHEISGERFLFHEYKINQMDGIISELSMLFTQVHVLKSAQDVENYILRLSKIPHKINKLLEILELQKQEKLLPPQFVVEKVINSLGRFLPDNKKEHIFYTHCVQQVAKLNLKDQETLIARIYDVLERVVYPACKILDNYLKNILQNNLSHHGVWALPDGQDYYAYILKFHTTTTLSPEQIHALGLRETRSIQTAMRSLLADMGIVDPQKSVGMLMQELSQDPELYYPDTQEGREQCLADYQAILERSRKELAHLFDLKPKAGVKIQRVPKHEEEGMPAAYYHSPSLDGSRPGMFFANLRNMAEVPKYQMETLTIHEAEPGHHFQIALFNEMQMPLLRKVGFYTAYAEGWALYVEKLAYEQGFYSSASAKLGHLQDELLRAVRLVVDTGIHDKRWSREQAIDYMQKELGYPYDSAVTEVERYFVIPGQACSYKIGQLKILELRSYAQEKLGKQL